VFVGCEWQQVNKARAQAQDPSEFDEMYESLLFMLSKYTSTDNID